MEIIKIARRPAVLGRPQMTVREAVALMAREGVGALVVVNSKNQLLGIFTERDCLLKVTHAGRDADQTTLSEVMTRHARGVPPEISADEALTLMIRNRFRHLPVVDSTNHVLGVASIRYLLAHKLSEQQSSIEVLSAYAAAGGPG